MKFLEQEINKLNKLYLGEKKSVCVYDVSSGSVEHRSIETGKPKKKVDMSLDFRKNPTILSPSNNQ